MRKIYVMLLAGLVLAWAAPAPAWANDADTTGAPKPNLFAKGDGFVHLECAGHAAVESKGGGVLVIANTDKSKIKILGKGKVFYNPKDKTLTVVGLKGVVHVKSKKVVLTYKGPLKLTVHGKGDVWLKGKGDFKIKGKKHHKWPLKQVKKFSF